MGRYLVLVLIGLSQAVWAGTIEYQITASGNDLPTLQKLKNCLDYRSCKPVRSSIVMKDAPNYRFHNFVFATESDIQKIIKECRISGFKITVTEAVSEQPVEELWWIHKFEVRREESPIEIKDFDKASLIKITETTAALLKYKKYEAAIKYALAVLHIPTNGYKFAFSKTVSAGVIVTDHETRTVSLGSYWFQNACRFFRVLRHEAEHIHQVEYDEKKCNYDTTFNDHDMRERSAYLNDILNVRKFCIVEADRKYEEKDATSSFETTRYHPAK